jgi:hypothetical protein
MLPEHFLFRVVLLKSILPAKVVLVTLVTLVAAAELVMAVVGVVVVA